MIALSSFTVGWILLVGIVIIGLISLLPSHYIETYTLKGRTAFRFVVTLSFFFVVFFFWMHSRSSEIRKLTTDSSEQSASAEELAKANEDRITDIERVRDDAAYTACVDRNDTRQRVRGEYGAIVAQEQAFLDRMRAGSSLDLSHLQGYSEVEDPAVVQVFDSVTALLRLNRQESLNQQQIEVQVAQEALDRYIADEPFEQCGDDPIPNQEPVRPPITAPLPQQTLPLTTSSTTTTLPPTTTRAPSPVTQATSPPQIQPTNPPPQTSPPTVARTTTTTDRPGNAGGNGNGNGGGNGNGNGNGNGRGKR